MDTLKIQSFTGLKAWQEAHRLVINVYRLTKLFPKEELFALTNQLRRAVVSISSNIAEGFSRNSAKEKIQFYSIALGSLEEVQNQLLIARDIDYLPSDAFKTTSEQTVFVSKLIRGLAKTAQTRNTSY